MMRALLFLMLSAATAAPAMAQADGPVVTIDSGMIRGTPADGGSPVQSFKGIPYARPPIGDLRWEPPAAPKRWDGVRAANAFGTRCMQKHMWDDMIFRSAGMSEDCLYLNVWTPAKLGPDAATQKLPVLVYVYGGGFVAGDSSEPRYDGAALAANGIVVVTMNYRLGIFGFFAHPQLTSQSSRKASGNYGLLDQAAAIAWVKRNIAAFGGDPRHITIGGESAGSMSVSGLMASPLTRKLIAGAIGESGSLMTPNRLTPLGDAEQAGMTYAEALEVPTVSMLRSVAADKLLAVQDYHGAQFGPVVDGYFLTEPPAVTFAAGKQAKVPLLIGSNSQEGAAAALLEDDAPTVANYRASLARRFGDRADQLFALYPAASDDVVVPAATELASDMFLGFATWKWFDLQRRSGAPTYYYRYDRVRPRALNWDAPAAWGAVHSAEIEYALGNLDTNPSYAWTDEDRRVSATMNGYFVNFIKTGDPNGAGLPLWPRASDDPAAIQRAVIDVDTRRALFADQARYVAAEPLLLAK